MNLTDRLTLAGFRAGWALVRRMPERAAYAMFERIADRITARGGKDVQRLRANYAKVRRELDDDELDVLVRLGMRSYFRYWCDAFRLEQVAGSDDIDQMLRLAGNGPEAKRILDGGDAVILFLAHLGNWDMCGAWATRNFARVTTVAERLKPEALFQQFVDYRASLGIRILPLTGGAEPYPELVAAVLAGGFVPLLSDRDLTSRGVQVQLCGHPARMAAGPARLALETGAALYPLSVTYEKLPGRAIQRVVADFGPRVIVPAEGTDREKITAMTQQCADALGDTIREHTQDWHMMQRVFVEDLSRADGAAP
ncbi:phosphatidylinositol mannoside acyltransferase [Allobranchiibius sp. GilTou73]|uniref:phosphatidylinositol mannoside acyltransferase n=1 Tax=Allobranchiibius sp. GilTou73 TaxID=2904523 RepID=UPI001F001C8A|nr:phosphatidylinositol mannoside acyltransferase [Allobranchiibius sp. GilTou73]UIJ33813.1 phosphatidylinositol mannoside acyltransferase [Allobranchiibius sp. GilTou73]